AHGVGPAAPPPLNVVVEPEPPTMTIRTSPGVTASVPVASPPSPPRTPIGFVPPAAPNASIVTCVTLAGTVNVCAAPVALNVCEPEAAHPTTTPVIAALVTVPEPLVTLHATPALGAAATE